MVWIIILLMLLSGVAAYFIIKIKIKYRYKVLIDFCILAICWLWFVLADVSELYITVLFLYTPLVILGIITHFVAPFILNIVGVFVAKLTKQSFSPLTYEEHLIDDNVRHMYSCVFLFTLFKIFLLIMFIASALNLIK